MQIPSDEKQLCLDAVDIKILSKLVQVVCLLTAKIALYRYSKSIYTTKNPQNSPPFFADVKKYGETK